MLWVLPEKSKPFIAQISGIEDTSYIAYLETSKTWLLFWSGRRRKNLYQIPIQFLIHGVKEAMNKSEFIKELAKESELPQKQVIQTLKCAIDLIARSLSEGDKVVITGFGTFEVRTRRERHGFNPKTKERIIIPETKTPGFTASNTLKNFVLGKTGADLEIDGFELESNVNSAKKIIKRKRKSSKVKNES